MKKSFRLSLFTVHNWLPPIKAIEKNGGMFIDCMCELNIVQKIDLHVYANVQHICMQYIFIMKL